MAEDKTATYTFLFTDIQGSTRRWEANAEAMSRAVALHDDLLRLQIESHDGIVFKTVGDAFCAVFASAPGALDAALHIQRAVASQDWGVVGPIEVRIALHTGTAQCRDNDYFGPTVNRVARILGVAHGGQTLLSATAQALVCNLLPAESELMDLGAHRLKDLDRAERLYQLCTSDLKREFPALNSLNPKVHNLPVHPTPLVGRTRELTELSNLLQQPEVRLVTLLGPGGTGKTRLSLQVAAESMDKFPDYVCFVPLAAVSDTNFVLPAMAQALGVVEKAGESLFQSLKEHLGDRKVLLVLDNCEQIVEASSSFADLLGACANLKMLASSRILLHVRGEREYRLMPLGLPEAGATLSVEAIAKYPALELFCQRARAVKSGFELTVENVGAVVEICRRLDGLPLAIELAAARVKLLTPQAMLSHLEQRLRLLTGGARDLPERHQTLRNAIDWSYELLEADEQSLFRRLAIFAGGCTVASAREVCATSGTLELDIIEALASLADKSLLRQDEDAPELRFGMLETIREYGLEQLRLNNEADLLERRYADYFLALAVTLVERLRDDTSLGSTDFAVDYDNFRATLDWCLSHSQADMAAEMTVSLSPFWERSGHFSEACEYLERVLALRDRISNAGVVAKLCGQSGWFAYLRGDYSRAHGFEQQSLEISSGVGDNNGTADALNELGLIAKAQGQRDQAKEFFERSLGMVRELGDLGKQAQRLSNLGLLCIEEGRFQEGRGYLEEAGRLYETNRDPHGTAGCLCNLAELALQTKDWSSASSFAQKSLEMFRKLDDQRGVAYCLANLAAAAVELGDHRAIAILVCEALQISWNSGMHWLIPPLIECAAAGQWEVGDTALAADLFAAADYFRDQLVLPRSDGDEKASALEGNLIATVAADLRSAREAIGLLDDAGVLARVVELLKNADEGLVYEN